MNELTSSALDKRSSLRVRKGPLFYLKRDWLLYLLLLPGVAYFILFKYLPIFGIIISFQNYKPFFGVSGIFTSEWFGLYWFRRFMSSYYFWRLMRNTFLLSFYSLLWSFPSAILLALLINELQNKHFKKLVQTISYLPHFLSIVIIAGIIRSLLSTDGGLFNTIIVLFGGQPIYFLGAPQYFRTIYVVSGVWQSIGWNTIIYLAAIAGVDGSLYEAAELDGAGVFRKMWHVTLPGILPVISLQLILNVGNLLNVGYEKVLLLYNDAILETADVIGTYVYREGLQNQSFSYSTAVGLFTSVLAMVMVLGSNAICKRLGQEGIW